MMSEKKFICSSLPPLTFLPKMNESITGQLFIQQLWAFLFQLLAQVKQSRRLVVVRWILGFDITLNAKVKEMRANWYLAAIVSQSNYFHQITCCFLWRNLIENNQLQLIVQHDPRRQQANPNHIHSSVTNLQPQHRCSSLNSLWSLKSLWSSAPLRALYQVVHWAGRVTSALARV